VSTPATALGTHQRLAWAYLDRMAAGDYTRASVVLSSIAALYPATRSDVISIVAPSQAGAFPRTLLASWGGDTASFVSIVLDSYFRGVGDTARSNAASGLDTIPAANIGAAARPLLAGAQGSVASFVQPIANADMGSINGTIATLVSGSLNPSGGSTDAGAAMPLFTASARSLIQSDVLRQAFQSGGSSGSASTGSDSAAYEGGGSAVIPLPETFITGQAASPGMPTWGWVALGALGVGVLGFAAYRYFG